MIITLEQADSAEFARWWVVYRRTNEDFSQSFAAQYHNVDDVPYCQWIMQDGQRVGGLIMVGQNVGDFFLIPPFQDAYAALKAILPAGPLRAQSIATAHLPAFQLLGFQITESRHWMIRPTQRYDVEFILTRTPLNAAVHTDDIADLMFAAFQGGIGEYGQRDVDTHRKSTLNFFETVPAGNICFQASSVVFDGMDMVAACLVQPYQTLATVRFIVTHPIYQGRGIARRLMEYAMSVVAPQYDHMALAVTIGNPAQALYHSMGFVTGDALHSLTRPG